MKHKKQSKSVGSLYFNVKGNQDSSSLAKAIKFLKKNDCYLSISMKNGDGGYDKFFGGFNDYKKKRSDPDIIIYRAQLVKKKQDDDFEDEVENDEDDDELF